MKKIVVSGKIKKTEMGTEKRKLKIDLTAFEKFEESQLFGNPKEREIAERNKNTIAEYR